MKENFIHVCFVIDKSGSMSPSANDVIGGFDQIVKEQKKVNTGKCAISLFTFDGDLKCEFLGKDVSEIPEFKYFPYGCTAMNDGIGTAIDKVGAWLRDMPESERPEKNLIVIMTDGEENSSHEYTLGKVQEMIKHQTEKYSWQFMYVGTDITTTTDADNLGIRMSSYSTRKNYMNNYNVISNATTLYRMSTGSSAYKSKCLNESLSAGADSITASTEDALGIKIKKSQP